MDNKKKKPANKKDTKPTPNPQKEEAEILEEKKAVTRQKQSLAAKKRVLEEHKRVLAAQKKADRDARIQERKEERYKKRKARRLERKKNKKELPEKTKRLLSIITGATCSALILTFSSLTVISVSNRSYENAPYYLIWVFFSMAFLTFIPYVKNRTKLFLIRCIVLSAFDIALGVMSLFARDNFYIFSLVGGLFCLSFIAARVFSILEDHSVRSWIFNMILITFAATLGVGLFIPVEKSFIEQVVLTECLFIAIVALVEIAMIAFSNFKFKVLFRIVVNTFALEILFGLLATMVASALVLLTVEDTFTNFGDSLWYTFAVVTTIGFGDFTALTPIGRVISVILGLYGIVAVAVITSIIVNFYNETSGKRDIKEMKKIEKQEDKEKNDFTKK